MNVLQFYTDRLEPLTFRGKTEKALVLRRGKSMSPKTIADGKIIVTDTDTEITDGELVTREVSGEKFLIIAKQRSADAVQMQGRRINGYIEVIRFEDVYEDYELVEQKAVTIAENVPVNFTDISASMKQYDAGLLQTTVKKIIMRPDIEIDLLYRIRLNGRNYNVVNVDTAKYVNLLEVQVSEDNR